MSSSNKSRRIKKHGAGGKNKSSLEESGNGNVSSITASPAAEQGTDSYAGHTNIGAHTGRGQPSPSAHNGTTGADEESVSSIPVSTVDPAESEKHQEHATENTTRAPTPTRSAASARPSDESAPAPAPAGQTLSVPDTSAATRDRKLKLLRSREVYSMQPNKKSEQLSPKQAGTVVTLKDLVAFFVRVLFELCYVYGLVACEKLRAMASLSFIGQKLLHVVDFVLSTHVKFTCKNNSGDTVTTTATATSSKQLTPS
jgi:hypothetical protein